MHRFVPEIAARPIPLQFTVHRLPQCGVDHHLPSVSILQSGV